MDVNWVKGRKKEEKKKEEEEGEEATIDSSDRRRQSDAWQPTGPIGAFEKR